MAGRPRQPRRIGRALLLAAWAALLITLAGGGAYLALFPDRKQPTIDRSRFVVDLPALRLPQAQPQPAPASDAAGEPATQDRPQAVAEATETGPPRQPPPPVALTPAPAPPAAPASGASSEAETQVEPALAPASPPQTSPAPSDPPQTAALPRLPSGPVETWQRFAMPFRGAADAPRVAVVIKGLGMSTAATEAAIKDLPPEITLSFSPYARRIDEWTALARAHGHEIMLDLPMEPMTFPKDDPGPHALMTGLSSEQNVSRLSWLLSRGSAYVGVAGVMGSRFVTVRDSLEPVMAELKRRGLVFLDNRATDDSLAAEVAADLGTAFARNDRSIDIRLASRRAIDAQLKYVERLALTRGYAIAMAHPYPVTIERLRDWADGLAQRGLTLVPLTAVVGSRMAASADHATPPAGG